MGGCLKLGQRAAFLQVQAAGRRLRGRHLSLLCLKAPGQPTRLGLTVSRRVGGAVVRNRVRRRLRELARRLCGLLVPEAAHVLIAQPSAAHATFAELSMDLRQVLARAHRL